MPRGYLSDVLSRVILASLLFAVLLTPLPAMASPPSAREVESALMCVTCHRRLSEASGPLAIVMDRMIRKDIAEGWSKTRIIDYFVHELGPQVRYTP